MARNFSIENGFSNDDEDLAVTLEQEFGQNTKYNLLIKFPDELLTEDIVRKFHSGIENVNFIQPYTPRMCIVTINEQFNKREIMKTLSNQEFSNGYLTVQKVENDNIVSINPTSLLLENIQKDMSESDLKLIFPECSNICINSKIDEGLYNAIVKFRTPSDAFKAFKRMKIQQRCNRSTLKFERTFKSIATEKPIQYLNPTNNNLVLDNTPSNTTSDASVKSTANKTLPCNSFTTVNDKVVKPNKQKTTNPIKYTETDIEKMQYIHEELKQICYDNLDKHSRLEQSDDAIKEELNQIFYNNIENNLVPMPFTSTDTSIKTENIDELNADVYEPIEDCVSTKPDLEKTLQGMLRRRAILHNMKNSMSNE